MLEHSLRSAAAMVVLWSGKVRFQYEGENTQAGLVSFIRNPQQPVVQKSTEESWADTVSNVHHLTADTFHTFIKAESSVLVMFYAPWCGHCKRIKPEYIDAAAELFNKGASGKLAAVDATKETALASEFSVKGFPTLKYFSDGRFMFEVPGVREKDKIVEFMLDPKVRI
ncbi:Thioredoxin domain [Trinorchestia longiramus]|nr:Thioredoxin domain [Trinorchestia longiramus]